MKASAGVERPHSDLEIHEASFRRLDDPEDFGLKRAIEFGLNWLDATLSVDSVGVSEAEWTARGWAATATVQLRGGAEEIWEVKVLVPRLLDAEAARMARETGPKVRVGSFRGTFWKSDRDGAIGRFRQPLVAFSWAPGIHRVTWPLQEGKGNTYRVLMVGEFGTAWRLRWDSAHKAKTDRDKDEPEGVVIRSRYTPAQPTRSRFAASMLEGTSAVSEELGRFREVLTDARFVVGLPEFDEDDLCDAVEWLSSVREDDAARVAERSEIPDESEDDASALRVPMHKRHWRPIGLGDSIASAIAVAVSKVAFRASRNKTLDLNLVVHQLRTAMMSAVDDAVLGRDVFSASVVNERPINTLAALETSRQRTFIGHGGLDLYHGRLDLRVLPTHWRGALCPLQTQESAKIGLVRHAALADWPAADPCGLAPTYADLSVAAALIPFIGHDDPTRAVLGSKMLKQAVILDQPEPPLIRTGIESLVGEVGVTRSPVSGRTGAVDCDHALIEVGSASVPFGRHATLPRLPGDEWIVDVRTGVVVEGDILAHAPDVVIEEDAPVFAYGLNATVAFLAWKGLNYEDGIVVSESFAERMASSHTVRLSAPFHPKSGEWIEELVGSDLLGAQISQGSEVLVVRGAATDRLLALPESARLLPSLTDDGYSYADIGDHEVRLAYRVTRPLQIGDKLTTRHGGKGVVTRIEPDERMPRLPDGRVVEVLLNPLGVIRRLNMGTLTELAKGLEAVLEDRSWITAPRVVPRRLGREARLQLADHLAELGAPGGKLKLSSTAGGIIGPADGVMVGPLYMVKLDHLAKQKGGARDDAAPSPLTFQPVRATTWTGDRRRASPQRVGEMEVWSLEALRAYKTLDDLMAVRGVGEWKLREDRAILPAGLRASLAYLSVAGVHFESIGSEAARDITVDPGTGAPFELVRAVWRGDARQSSLIDVVEAFEEKARALSKEEIRRARGSDEKAEPSYRAVADQIIVLALASSVSRDVGIDRGTGQTVRYEIALPSPVDHTWAVRLPRGAWKVLPSLGRLAILPASSFLDAQRKEEDPIRRRYRDILRWVLIYRDATDERNRVIALHRIDTEVRAFLGSIRDPGGDPSTIAGRLTGKYGLLRRNGLGAAAIRSGRAVLVGDPDLDPEQVRIPRWMADDLQIPESSPDGYQNVVLVNRQPTLHPYNLQALRADVWDEWAVALHPILLQSIAGDFDGDTVAVHRLESEDARREIWDLRRPSAALRSGASSKMLLAKLDQDVQLGLAFSTDDASPDVPSLAESKLKLSGIDETDASQRVKGLHALVALQKQGLLAAHHWGPSVIALDPPDEAELDCYLSHSAVDLWPGIVSGAAGKKEEDRRQWLIARGTAVPPFADLPSVLVQGNYLDGLADEDYFAAAQPAIAALAAKKLLTPFAGTLTRNMVRHGYEVVIASEDCDGHSDGIEPSVFDCRDVAGPCAKAYGPNPETGAPVPVGDPVGIRAALFIGEKGTQTALKSIHDRSGKNAGKDKLRELGGMLLGDVQQPDSTVLHAAGEFKIPKGFEQLEPLKSALSHKNLAERVRRLDFPGIPKDAPITHAETKRMGEVLVARFREILPEVSPVHAAVLIRQRFLLDDHAFAALPEGAAEAYPAASAILPSAVWNGRVKKLVRELGVFADVVGGNRPTAFADQHRHDESTEFLSPGERLAATIRNSRPGGDDAKRR